jgi:hypothetical protein
MTIAPSPKGTSFPKGNKQGGQKGNQNARKHGLYSKKFVQTHTLTVDQRKAMLDACIAKMFETFKKLDDVDEMSKCLNSLSVAITAANNCERTAAILNGNYTPIEDVLNALRYLDPQED